MRASAIAASKIVARLTSGIINGALSESPLAAASRRRDDSTMTTSAARRRSQKRILIWKRLDHYLCQTSMAKTEKVGGGD